ncbi:acyltransferase [Rothia sp. P7181]|uniref:acyltransferase n=1 Tax=unclassified Rothia (in: high G+C Gram-positive bacteria) TaxID=2689056 RepID=UPI003AEA80AF
MHVLKAISEYTDQDGNRIIYSGEKPLDNKISITFRGKNNTLVVHEKARIRLVNIQFDQNNGRCEIGANDGSVAPFSANIRIGEDSSALIGDNVSTTTPVQISAVEGTTVRIGNDVMIAGSVKVRGDDGHPIFDVRTNQRINTAKDITIKNHVWLGIESYIMGGADISDGCVVGARSIVNKAFPNNCIIAGSPAKIIRRNIAWERPHLSMASPAYKDSGDTVEKSDYWNITVDL